MTITTTATPIQRAIFLLDFSATGATDGLAGGIGPGDGGITGPEGSGIAGSGGGVVCVGGCGLVCGSIDLSASLIYSLIVTHAKHNGYSIYPVQLLEWIT